MTVGANVNCPGKLLRGRRRRLECRSTKPDVTGDDCWDPLRLVLRRQQVEDSVRDLARKLSQDSPQCEGPAMFHFP